MKDHKGGVLLKNFSESNTFILEVQRRIDSLVGLFDVFLRRVILPFLSLTHAEAQIGSRLLG